MARGPKLDPVPHKGEFFPILAKGGAKSYSQYLWINLLHHMRSLLWVCISSKILLL